MRRAWLGWLAAACLPGFVAGVVVSVRCYWSATEARVRLRTAEYRVRASETGVAVARIAPPVVHVIPDPPPANGLIGRSLFTHRGWSRGRVRIDLVHVPYWPLWMITTPAIVAWLFQKAQDELRSRRAAQNLCVVCGYDLRASVSGICPECGSARGSWRSSDPAVRN